MGAQWERWLKYAKAKVDDTVKQGDAELDRREAELEARRAGTPWTEAGDSFDQAKARIEHMAGEMGTRPTTSSPGSSGSSTVGPADTGAPTPEAEAVSVQMAARQKAAEERLAAMRAELGLGGDPPESDEPSTPAP